jgi:hypothetical protein
MTDDSKTIALRAKRHLREFLYLIRNSFFVPKVEQAF